MRKNSIKNTRINSEVQRELSTLILREIKDPRISKMTSVVAVEVAPDLKTAKVYVSVLGSEDEIKATYDGLKSAAPYLRGQLAKTVNLRNTPELIFIMDQSIEYGVNMSKLIDDITSKEKNDKDEDDVDFSNVGYFDEDEDEDESEEDDEDFEEEDDDYEDEDDDN